MLEDKMEWKKRTFKDGMGWLYSIGIKEFWKEKTRMIK